MIDNFKYSNTYITMGQVKSLLGIAHRSSVKRILERKSVEILLIEDCIKFRGKYSYYAQRKIYVANRLDILRYLRYRETQLYSKLNADRTQNK